MRQADNRRIAYDELHVVSYLGLAVLRQSIRERVKSANRTGALRSEARRSAGSTGSLSSARSYIEGRLYSGRYFFAAYSKGCLGISRRALACPISLQKYLQIFRKNGQKTQNGSFT